MTWRKTGAEFDDQCADVNLSDHAYRTHMEAIGYIYKTENRECRVNKGALRRFATSEKAPEAIQELLDVGFWANLGTHYEVIHHADVITESLDAQQAKRDRDRTAQQRHRERKAKGQKGAPGGRAVSGDVSADPRQTDRQTDKHLEGGPMTTCRHGTPNGTQAEPWSDGDLVCAACTRERRSA